MPSEMKRTPYLTEGERARRDRADRVKHERLVSDFVIRCGKAEGKNEILMTVARSVLEEPAEIRDRILTRARDYYEV